MRRIRFLVCDLSDRQLAQKTTGQFDFISCHGVLSYVPEPERALRNLSRCLKPGGALYLGVNGAEHFSVVGRKFLSQFGFNMTELHDEKRLRRVLKLCDALLDNRRHLRMANQTTGYLAGDLFGPLIHNFALKVWVGMARIAGLHFQGSYSGHYLLRAAMERDFPELLMPRSHSDICTLLETLCPSSFHRLLFMRQPEDAPPWKNRGALFAWRPALTNLYELRLPKRSRRSRTTLRRVTFKSPTTNTRLDWQMPEWEVELVRQSDGTKSLARILDAISNSVPPQILAQQLYALYNLMAIDLLPPVGTRLEGGRAKSRGIG
jgi:hypothetical protein